MNAEPELDDLIEMFLAQMQRGESVNLEDFLSAHPSHAEELRGLLPILLDMEGYSRRRAAHRADDAAAEKPPAVLGGDYRLERVLGRGGMGTVWEAQQLSLDRKVAVKVLAAPNPAAEGDSFVQEARIVAQLHHPNIVKVYGAGPCDDSTRYWYAMELVEGTEFNKYAFPEPRAVVQAVEQAARALAYAHRCGVVHRDVKPANLILDQAGTVRVTDFGLAAVLTGQKADDEGARDGTVRYMAPERFTEGTCSFAADQYALGITLWELIARRPVFAAPSPRALVECVKKGPVPPLEGVDADLAAVVAKATAHRVDERYGDLSAFADDLCRWLSHETVAAAPASPLRRLRLWTRRNPAAAVGAAAALLCAMGFVGALTAGYVRTSSALNLAAHNAALADSALGDVFQHMEAEPASRRNAELMSALLPYYGKLADTGGLAPEKTADANAALGICALRSGDYAQAESAFRRLCAIRPSARALNLLSETLLRRSNVPEANALARRVVDEFAQSAKPEERFEAARALVALDRRQRVTRHRQQAFDLVNALLKDYPDNPEYRFLHAVLLSETPRLGAGKATVNEEPFTALAALAADYPERSDYALAFVRAVTRQMRQEEKNEEKGHEGNKKGQEFFRKLGGLSPKLGGLSPQKTEGLSPKQGGLSPQKSEGLSPKQEGLSPREIEKALQTADRLLGRQPNVPDVVTTVLAFRTAFVAHLRRTGDTRRATFEKIRTSGMLEMLAHNPEAPDASLGQFAGSNGKTFDYRQILVGDREAEPVTLILFLHHRSQMGKDNALPLTSPVLRRLVTRAETATGRTVFLVPQCPAGRANAWIGANRGHSDNLLEVVAELTRQTALTFGVSSNRVFVVGTGAGAAACRVFAQQKECPVARFFLAEPVPAKLPLSPAFTYFSEAALDYLWPPATPPSPGE